MPTKTKTKQKQKQKQTINIRISNVNKQGDKQKQTKRRQTKVVYNPAVNPYDRAIIVQDPRIYSLSNELDNIKRTQQLIANVPNTPITLANQQQYLANQGINLLDKINDDDVDRQKLINMEQVLSRNRSILEMSNNDGIYNEKIEGFNMNPPKLQSSNKMPKLTPQILASVKLNPASDRPLPPKPPPIQKGQRAERGTFAPTQKELQKQIENIRGRNQGISSAPASVIGSEYSAQTSFKSYDPVLYRAPSSKSSDTSSINSFNVLGFTQRNE